MSQNAKTVLLALAVLVGLLMMWQLFQGSWSAREIPFSEFLDRLEAGEIEAVLLKDKKIFIQPADKEEKGRFRYELITYDPGWPQLVDQLRKHNVVIRVEKPDSGKGLSFLLSWLPVLLLVGLWYMFFKQMQASGSRAISFSQSKARLLSPDQKKKVTFKDVAGVDEAKEELQEIIEFLKDSRKFQRLGGKIPKGVLLMGPPGTGKTLLARAVAGEANVPFFSISGSDFVEMFVGVGASRVRDLFEQGKKNAPCIIFIDELDAVGRHRGAGLGGGHDEREQTLNQLLVEMDGMESTDTVILIAATNRPDVLDPALLRPGRFDRRIVVNLPDVKGREAILKVHTAKIPLADDVDLSVLARATPSFSGADLAAMVNEAALRAARLNKDKVDMDDFEFAKDKVIMGSERRSLVMSEKEREKTAYHEAGHALVAALEPDADPIHKVTIIPRGMALGVTQQLPTEDRYTYSKRYLLASIKVLMGGRVAEELVFGPDEITSGAGSDLEKATELARKMVCSWGMSDAMGPLTFGKREESIFLGKEFFRHQDYSEATARKIDSEISRIVTEAYNQASELIRKHKNALVAVATALLEKEILDSEQLCRIIAEHSGIPLEELRRRKAKETSETN